MDLSLTLTYKFEDSRPVVVLKSHSGTFSETTTSFLATLHDAGGHKVIEIKELLLLVTQETTRGQALTPQERFHALSRDFGTSLWTRVFNSISWNVRRNPELFNGDYQVIYAPHGDSRIADMVSEALLGLTGSRPKFLNQIPLNGELVVDPELPLIDLDIAYHGGRKLRDIRDQALQAKQRGFAAPVHHALVRPTLTQATQARDTMGTGEAQHVSDVPA